MNEDPKWYEKLRNGTLGFSVSLARTGVEIFLIPERVTYYVGDKITGNHYNETLAKSMDSLEERCIVNYLVKDKESYYEGRRDGAIIMASLGKLAEWVGMAGMVAGTTIGGGGAAMMATGVGAAPGAVVTAAGGVVIVAGGAAWGIGKVITIPIEADLRKMSNNIYMMQSESGVSENELVDESSGRIGESGSVKNAPSGKASSKYLEELDNLPKNKVEHIIEGSKKLGHSHRWERLSKEKDWNEIKKIICDVMENGTEYPSGSASCRFMQVNGHRVEVRFKRLPNGVIKFSDAFVDYME